MQAPFLASLLALGLACPAAAQNIASSGGGWSSSWGFQSPSDASIALQKAQAIRAARQPQLAPVYNTYNDNRQNYQENMAMTGGSIGTANWHSGDEIGQNTNSIGSMNTGTTNIDITGNANSVVATNGADNAGCVDGSISANQIDPMSLNTTSGIDISVVGLGARGMCR